MLVSFFFLSEAGTKNKNLTCLSSADVCGGSIKLIDDFSLGPRAEMHHCTIVRPLLIKAAEAA